MKSFGVAKTRGGGVGFDRQRVRLLLKSVHQRLNKVVIENIPYERCFDNYDAKETFFFIDPPYLNAKIQAYAGWTEEQMRGFKRNLEKLKGRWVVTVDDSDFNRRLFSDCHVDAVSSQNKCVNVRLNGAQTFGELIITP